MKKIWFGMQLKNKFKSSSNVLISICRENNNTFKCICDSHLYVLLFSTAQKFCGSHSKHAIRNVFIFCFFEFDNYLSSLCHDSSSVLTSFTHFRRGKKKHEIQNELAWKSLQVPWKISPITDVGSVGLGDSFSLSFLRFSCFRGETHYHALDATPPHFMFFPRVTFLDKCFFLFEPHDVAIFCDRIEPYSNWLGSPFP